MTTHDVVDVVSGYVPELRKSGRNFVALCPFHAERTPSFVVFPDRGLWRCFGACATGGDVFAFVMRIEGLSYPNALKLMAERVGLSLPQKAGSTTERNGLLMADGFDEAILGVCERAGSCAVVAYDRDKCIDILVARDGMEYEEAVEYFEFNVIGSWVGEHTPVYITVRPGKEDTE